MPFVNSVRGSFGAQSVFGKEPSLNFFGDGSDGDLTVSTNTSLTVLNKSGAYDGDMLVRQYNNLTINSGITLTTDQPCRGLFIFVKENSTFR